MATNKLMEAAAEILASSKKSATGMPSQKLPGIGTTNPTSALHVLGDGRFTGVVPAITFSGQVNAGVSTLGIATATNLTSQQIIVSGISTFSGITTVTGSTLFAKQLNVPGVITATSFIGNGSGLTGITATGSGIGIRDDGAIVGTAGTIDFGVGLDVSAASSGIVTVSSNINYVPISGISTYAATAGVATYAATSGVSTIAGYATTAGISTTSQGLTGTPNILVGVVTATSFVVS